MSPFGSIRHLFRRALPAALLLGLAAPVSAQFYQGSYQEFGKNRVQYEEFLWTSYKFDKYNVYFYTGGRELGIYTAKTARTALKELEQFFDYYVENKMHIIVYNKLEHFRQSNIGLAEENQEHIGGVTQIAGSKIFVYFNGDHSDLERQIRAGIAQIVINQMMFGDNWKEMVKNSALMTLPDWYVDGLISYSSEPWNVEIDNRVRDGIMTGKFEKFNRLTGIDARYAGHSLWHYIAQSYGKNVIPNILYMSRISRNIESGFLFVLGISLKTLTEESLMYYKTQYELDDEERNSPKSQPVPVKIKKDLVYTQLKTNPDGKKVTFTTNDLGKYKVWIYDYDKDKKKKAFKGGIRLDRINDYSYPLVAWHPEGKVLAIIHEKKGKIDLTLYSLEDKKKRKVPIFKLEKVLDFSYSDDGNWLVLSGIAKGQSDIYVYKIASRIQEQLTNDIYDDLNPRFVDRGKKIIFSSNRPNDTLRHHNAEDVDYLERNKDIFVFNYARRSSLLRRLTNTPDANETSPDVYNEKYYTYLSDENGITNRYVSYFDSVISHVDTAIHYRYVSRAMPVTNYSRNILEQDINTEAGKYAEIVYHEGKYGLYIDELSSEPQSVDIEMKSTGYREEEKRNNARAEKNKKKEKPKEREEPVIATEATYTTIEIPQETAEEVNPAYIDIENYQFSTVKQPEKKEEESEETKKSRFITLTSEGKESEETEFKLPNIKDYHLAFAATDIITQFDFDFANQLYQLFNGGPYVNPGLGIVTKIALKDLFEDYQVEGGARLSFGSNSKEFFLSLENRERRLDKLYSFQRQTLGMSTSTTLYQLYIHQGKYVLKWPFNEVAALRGTFNIRHDQVVAKATDELNAMLPNGYIWWMGAKLEFIFDNTINKGLNLYNGLRYKLWGEYYKEIFEGQTDIQIIGLDIRHYQKIHRDLIWANRFAASTSFGNRQLVYYMGSVDNRLVFSALPRFLDTPIAMPPVKNYYFQTLATPMRGFLQNIRNGNSMALFNSEIRFPVFKYALNRPIKSDFVKNFQIITFGDIGTAWSGKHPWSDDNSFNTQVINKPPLTITLKNQKGPIVGGYGLGLRSRIWGYFVRLDYAWGVEDGIINKPIAYFSLGMDF